MKLLLVEDNLENAKLIICILRTGGYEVTHTIYVTRAQSELSKKAENGQ